MPITRLAPLGFSLAIIGMLAGCGFAGPTNPGRIEAIPVPQAPYDAMNCAQLQSAFKADRVTEHALSDEQQQSVDNQKLASEFVGPFVPGDGTTAHRLGVIRGRINAVLAAVDKKHCQLTY